MASRGLFAEPQEGFPIRAVARMTGIEADTLRVWERRYGFPKPRRTEGGARVYSSEDVEVLRLVARALERGFRAGELVARPRAELEAILQETQATPVRPAAATSATSRADRTLDLLVRAIVAGDVGDARAELRRLALTLGAKTFVRDVAAPLAHHVGELWEAGSIEIRHEHLLTELLTTQLRHLLSAAEEIQTDGAVLLATPEGERHGLGLEMIAVYLAYQQVLPRLLGESTPADQIVEAARSLRVDAVGLTITQAGDARAIAGEVRRIADGLRDVCTLWLGGAGAVSLSVAGGDVRLTHTWSDVDAAIAALRRQRPPPGRRVSGQR